jgi:hypothetical protein
VVYEAFSEVVLLPQVFTTRKQAVTMKHPVQPIGRPWVASWPLAFHGDASDAGNAPAGGQRR